MIFWAVKALFPLYSTTVLYDIKWSEDNGEFPGWYQAFVEEYYTDGSCKIVYSEDDGQVVYETVDFNKAQWLPCSKGARKFVPLQTEPVVSKLKRKPSLKVVSTRLKAMQMMLVPDPTQKEKSGLATQDYLMSM